MMQMLFRFLGGAREVGRSAILLEDGGHRMLLDYGVKLDHKTEYPLPIQDVEAAVLSHAHLDHSGYFPALYNKDYLPVIGTAPTLKLSSLLLEDSLSIARKQHVHEKFHKRQIRSFENRYVQTEYHSGTSLGGFNVELFDAGHISGSAITLLERKGRRIVYTGDFKLAPQELHSGAEVVKSNILITETTYATRKHPDRQNLIADLISKVRETLDNGGTALLPVFAVGRSQEILTILYKNHLADRAYLDGMARSATSIALKYPHFIRDSETLAKAANEVMAISEHNDRKRALDEPSIIVTTAGMLNGGPVLDYITRLNEKSHIFLTGYQVEGTNGRTLLEKGTISEHGEQKKITTPVSYYDLSAHADKDDLYKYAKQSSPEKIICVHGDAEAAEQFAETMKLDGFDAVAPSNGDTIEL